MVKWLLLSALTGGVTLLIYLYVYLGASKPVTFTQKEVGPLPLLYKIHTGPYHQIMSNIHAAEAWARENKMDCSRTFGEFLDDPKAVDEDRLRSRVGCILERPPDGVALGDFTFELRPARHYAVAHFGGSPSIGPFKVYPKLQDYLQSERLATNLDPVIEVYRVNGDHVETEYLFPLSDK